MEISAAAKGRNDHCVRQTGSDMGHLISPPVRNGRRLWLSCLCMQSLIDY